MMTEDREPRSALLLGLCLLVVACVYVRVLEGPFIWDDQHLIAGSTAVRNLDPAQAFKQPFWIGPPGEAGSHSYYRPLTSLTLIFDYWLHRGNSAGFHLTNLVLHLLVVSFLFVLLRRRGCSARLAFLLASAWALLPRLTEAAAWISGRGDVLMTVLSLAALWVYRRGSTIRFSIALFFALLALLAKESGVGVLFALLILELHPSTPAASSSNGLRLTGLALPLVVYVALRGSAGALLLGDSLQLGAAGRVWASLEALGRYAFMLLDPLQPRSLLGQLGHVEWPYVGLGVVTLVAAGLIVWRLHPARSEGWAFAALGLLPLGLVLHITPLPLTVVAADRYLYLPAAALLVVAAPALQRSVERRPWWLGAALVFALVCGVRTFQRVGDYVDDALFWTTAARWAPRDDTALISLGSVAYRAGLFAESLSLNRKAFALGGTRAATALDDAALSATALGDRQLAARLGEQLVTTFPRIPAYQMRRAAIALTAHDFQRAQAGAEKALAISPAFTPARGFLGLVTRSRAVAVGVNVPPAVLQSFDMEALRYPEIVARLNTLLDQPGSEDTVIRAGLEFMIANGDPQQARDLFEKFVQRRSGSDVERLAAALTLRLRAAANIRARLSELAESR
jgi:tetratricopeptide (TPR) repeat protein